MNKLLATAIFLQLCTVVQAQQTQTQTKSKSITDSIRNLPPLEVQS